MVKKIIAKENWTVIKKVLANVQKTDTATQNIHIAEKYLEVTDEKVAIRIKRKIKTLEKGVYRVLSANKLDSIFLELILEKIDEKETYKNMPYPDFSRYFPADTSKLSLKIEKLEILPERRNPLSLSSTVIKLYQLAGNAYSTKLLAIIAEFLECNWTAYDLGNDKPVYLVSKAEDVEVLVMPFRMV